MPQISKIFCTVFNLVGLALPSGTSRTRALGKTSGALATANSAFSRLVRCLVSAPAHQTAVYAREVTSVDARRVEDDANDVQTSR